MSTERNEHREWTERMSSYLDGDLSSEESGEVEGHLSECGSCRLVLEEMREVISRANSLGDVQPKRDLWGGIAATIQAPVPTGVDSGAKVIALPLAKGRPDGDAGDSLEERRRFAFTTPQLIAASVALIAASSVATWASGPGLQANSGQSDMMGSAGGAVSMAADLELIPASQGLADELVLLEEALEVSRTQLDPNTMRVLERNLAVIEQAIEDSHRALSQDPGNEFLSEHLERVYERKRSYLRDATRMAEWAG